MEEQIKKLLNEGKTRRQISSLLGCSLYTISKYIDLNNITEIGKKIIELRKQGKSIKYIKDKLQCSKSTVSKWANTVKNNKQIIEKNTQNKKEDKKEEIKKPIITYRKWKKEIRKKRKKFFLSLFDNKCYICGYDKTPNALCFHHIDSINKSFNISGTNLEKSISILKEEIEKCVVLCQNCHIEVHDGLHDNIKFKPITIENIPNEICDFQPIKISKETYDKEVHWVECKRKYYKNKKIINRENSNFDLDKIKIDHIDNVKLNDILENYHYLKTSFKGHIYKLGFYYENKIIGACLITNPVRSKFKKTCEISRFCLCYNQKNLASKCISLIISYVKNNSNYEYIQAFSQNDKHFGTIYKASNFKKCGSSFNTYNYDGIHKKTIYERAKSLGLKEKEYVEKFNLNKIQESSKTKYIYKLS